MVPAVPGTPAIIFHLWILTTAHEKNSVKYRHCLSHKTRKAENKKANGRTTIIDNQRIVVAPLSNILGPVTLGWCRPKLQVRHRDKIEYRMQNAECIVNEIKNTRSALGI